MLPIFQKRNFVIKPHYIGFQTAKYTEAQKKIYKLLPVITDVSQVKTIEGFNYSEYYNANHTFKQEASKVVYYALKRGKRRYQVVKKNIVGGLCEIVPNIVSHRIDLCVQIQDWCTQWNCDLTEVYEPELPPVFEMVTNKQGRKRLELTSYGFVTNFKAINHCPPRPDSEALVQNNRKLYDNF